MDKKIGVYLCTGCDIGRSLKVAGLIQVATGELKAPVCRQHPFLCGAEGRALIRQDMEQEGLGAAVIAACSPRANTDAFDFGDLLVVRVSLREQVAWVMEPGDEDTQMAAADYLRMGITRARKSEVPLPFLPEGISRTLLVVGGGVTGMTAALEAAEAGYPVVLVERGAELGGWLRRLHRQIPRRAPYAELPETGIAELAARVREHPRITLFLGRTVEQIAGQPGQFSVTLSGNGTAAPEPFAAGAVVQATGWKPYDATRLGSPYGFGRSANVITSVQLEEMAAAGRILRPSDGRPPRSVAFIQCAGSRDAQHLPYCSSVCCLTSLKQSLYVRRADPQSKVYILYRDIRAPGQKELFYKKVQENEGIFLTKGVIQGVEEAEGGDLRVTVGETLLGEDIEVRAELVVLATGMVPNSLDESALGLQYRQGPELPALRYGFPDSHYVCFPYETRRTGIYAAGPLRTPMDSAGAAADAAGAAMKAIQCLEMTARGEAVHPRSGDRSYPDFFLQRCTQCKRCTEECPFGVLNEDVKGTPQPNPTRCRRCGVCMGACPERIVSFKDYSVEIISSMIKAVEVPEAEEEKPRVLAFLCENDAYPSLDICAARRLRISPYLRIIPLRCLGSMNIVWIADSLSKGFDGVLLIGCKSGDDYQCHFIKGSELASYRMGNVQETLQKLVLERERVHVEELSITDYQRLPEVFARFMETIEAVGPNPYKGF